MNRQIIITISKIIIYCALALGCIYLGYYSHEHEYSAIPDFPEKVVYNKPAPDVSADLAPFIGKWDGKWSGKINVSLAITDINNQSAKILYSMADYLDFGITAFTHEDRAHIIRHDPPTLVFMPPWGEKILFILGPGGKSLEGQIFAQYYNSGGYLKKVEDADETYQYSLPSSQVDLPLPADTTIIIPSDKLSPALRRLSGRWEGKMNGTTSIIVIVKKISGKKAELIISRDHFFNLRSIGYEELTAKVRNTRNGPRIYAQTSDHYRFTLAGYDDPNSAEIRFEADNELGAAYLRKVKK